MCQSSMLGCRRVVVLRSCNTANRSLCLTIKYSPHSEALPAALIGNEDWATLFSSRRRRCPHAHAQTRSHSQQIMKPPQLQGLGSKICISVRPPPQKWNQLHTSVFCIKIVQVHEQNLLLHEEETRMSPLHSTPQGTERGMFIHCTPYNTQHRRLTHATAP